MAMDIAALQARIEELEEENEALLEQLRMAQLGGVDMRGHLSKHNPNASQQGIFAQDWELRYFVLSGTLLKYYTSERDVGYTPRGVLDLEGCFVEVEQPVGAKGPFIFQIQDPDDGLLLRLSADTLSTAKTWLRTLHSMGLQIIGGSRLQPSVLGGHQQQQQQQGPPDSQAHGGGLGLRRSLASLSRAISGRWQAGVQNASAQDSVDSDMSVFRLAQQHQHLHPHWTQTAARAAAAAGVAAGSHAQQQQQQQQGGGVSLQRGSSAPVVQIQPSVGGPGHEDDVIWEDDDAITSKPTVSRSLALSRSWGSRRWGNNRVSAAEGAAAVHAAAADGNSEGGSGCLPGAMSLSQIGRAPSIRTGSGLLRSSQSRRWGRADIGDELPACEHLSDMDESSSMAETSSEEEEAAEEEELYKQSTGKVQQQLQDGSSSSSSNAEPTTAAAQQEHQQQGLASTAAAAAGSSSSSPFKSSGVQPPTMTASGGQTLQHQQQQPPPAAVGSGSSGSKPPAVSSAAAKTLTKARKPQMDGSSPVHVGAKDSLLTVNDNWGVSRHEGLLNLGVVVLLATNIRLIMSNLLTYGLRLKLNKAVLQAALQTPLSHDDVITFAAVPACAVFALLAWLIELAGLRMLLAQHKVLRGLQKKEVSSSQVAKRAAALTVRQEGVMFCLNLLNAGGSLVLPCWLVLSNKASLIPASCLTVAAIITSMKLATYAHCNTTLRRQACKRAHKAAAAGQPIPDATLLPVLSRQGSSSTGSTFRRSMSARGAASFAVRGAAVPLGVSGGGGAAAGGDVSVADVGQSPAATSRAPETDNNGNTAPLSPFLAAASALPSSSSPTRRNQVLSAAGTGGQSGLHVQQVEVFYPWNLTPQDVAFFMMAPTLTYQLNFPRFKQRRWTLLSRWVMLLLLTVIVMSFMQIQFLMPCMQRSLEPLREMDLARFLECILRVAVPNTCVWLAMFYLVFHLWLNIIGELLLFGDRMFYKEWWNAATLGDYWKLWNVPVHKWMLRTVFFPLVRRGCSKLPAMLFVFFVSAVMHELAVGVPLRMLRGWAFWGMMLQVPLIILTEVLRKRLKADNLGNMVFWASFCVLGQPMCLIMYYHDWLLANTGVQGIQQAALQGAGAVAAAAAAANTTSSLVI